ncbi:Conserved_hypothetical protein [Hexamita inflata]|uniref:Uncharacterized protein n=1 Tax=Hexamita inflata TaxID=28002 RepID=A0AA86UU48_9EUKA|nr:Conserved hypothetical protein [Hexamita inflata]CAI9964932.1 Conserved hypothetical protein [Hexamita inflata]
MKQQLAQQFVNRVSERQAHKDRQQTQKSLMAQSGQINQPLEKTPNLDVTTKFESECGIFSTVYAQDELNAFEQRIMEHRAKFGENDEFSD